MGVVPFMVGSGLLIVGVDLFISVLSQNENYIWSVTASKNWYGYHVLEARET